MTTTVSSDSEIGLKYGYRPAACNLTRLGELPALLEERDLLKLLCIHGASAQRGGEECPHIAMSLNGFKVVIRLG